MNSWEHITPVLWSLHWLPIFKWIKQCMHETVPQYLQELVSQYNYSIWSSPLLFPVQTKHLWIWWKALRCKVINAAPTPWNRQTHSKLQKQTLHLFSGRWNHICFQFPSHPTVTLTGSLFPVSPVPSPHSLLYPFFHHLCQAQWACGCLHGD